MKFIGKIPLLIVFVLAWIVIVSSCANQGMPTGGPLDSFPPIIVNTQPGYRALNYKGKEVRLTFDEYINSSKVLEELIISPPMEKRPTVLTKSKTLIVRFNEDLNNNVTYSLDFKNGVVDNNENNPYKGLRFSFSTGNSYDSLRVEGHVFNGFNLDTPENILVMLHNNLNDSAILTLRPNYIAKVDTTGYFLIDNISSGHYNLFAINDQNNDLKYNEGTEGIAFLDSVIVPFAEYVEMVDTVVNDNDSFLISGHTHFFPEPVFMRYFTENIFNQYIKTYTRSLKYKCDFIFNQPINDSFNVNLLNNEFENWYLLEQNSKMDSITLWITDTTLANRDTLLMEVSYFQLDTLKQPIIQKDTLALSFTAQGGNSQPRRERSRDENEEVNEEILPVTQFEFITNTGSVLELNNDIEINFPEPIHEFDSTLIKLYLTGDTLKTHLEYSIMQDSLHFRTYKMAHKWEPGTSYTLDIDSTAFTNIYGITSKKMSSTFQTRDNNYYGQIILNFSDVKSPIIAQLLRNDNNETVLRSKSISSDSIVTFDYLAPEKYVLKIIYDGNSNGKWDSGNFKSKLQPERVAYHNEVVKVRSNWNNEISWAVDENPEFIKNIIDAELEAQKSREAEQQNRTN
ncbi:MAG: Ig-like domain-containing protein [Bacteroidales bacterium]|jgi:uncharacterized protein (DUF2141 family)|nr:Ig-like domain-containing protein [Bacteroidales bacterium]